MFDSETIISVISSTPGPPGDGCVGYITSGGYGWRTNTHIAVGWLSAHLCTAGTELNLEILGERCRATVASDPVYDPGNIALRS